MPLTVEQLTALLGRYGDAFRLSIRLHSEIEKAIDEGIEAAFPDAATRARSFGGFERRLHLAVALGLINRDHRAAIKASEDLRHEFAHGTIEELSDERARVVLDEVRAADGDDWEKFAQLAVGSPMDVLAFALAPLYLLVVSDLEVAQQRRERVNEALERQTLHEVIQLRRAGLLNALADGEH